MDPFMLSTLVETVVLFLIFILIGGGYYASKCVERDTSTGDFVHPVWWPLSKHFMSKSRSIVYSLLGNTVVHIAMTNDLYWRGYDEMMYVWYTLVSYVLIVFLYTKAMCLPSIIREALILRILHVLCTFNLVIHPMVSLWLLHHYSPEYYVWWSIYHSVSIIWMVALFVKPLSAAKNQQNDYLKPIICENVYMMFVLTMVVLVGGWVYMYVWTTDWYRLVMVKIHAWISLMCCLYTTRWGWRDLEDKNRERTSTKRRSSTLVITDEKKKRILNRQPSEIAPVSAPIPAFAPTQLVDHAPLPCFETCIFPRHRRSMSMVHIDFERFTSMSTPQKTYSLTIPV